MYFRAILRLRPVLSLRFAANGVSAYRISLLSPILSGTNTSVINFAPQRYKTYSKQGNTDTEEEFEDDQTLSRDSKVIKFNCPSTRMDIILKSGLAISRNKIEKIFYESKIRLNGKKVIKKSVQIHAGDEIDVIKGPSQKNPAHLYVSRVEVLDMSPGEESIVITARRFKSLLIENYEEDPYRHTAEEDS